MDNLFKAFERFLFRDMSFVLGGSIVIASATYVYNTQPVISIFQVFNNFESIKLFIAVGVAYAVGYSVQESFTLVRLVRTKAGHSPNWLGKLLYRLFDCQSTQPVNSMEYDRAKLWLYEQATPQRFRDDHERTESLKHVGTTLGPCFLISGLILICKQPLVGGSVAFLGLILFLLGWLKVTQQAQYLIRRFRTFHGQT